MSEVDKKISNVLATFDLDDLKVKDKTVKEAKEKLEQKQKILIKESDKNDRNRK